MKDLTLEYIAGFVDGDGSFMILKRGDGSYQTRFSIANTNKQILEDIRKFFSITFKVQTAHQYLPNRRPLYKLHTASLDDCKSIATQLEPYLRLKKEHAQIIMQYPRADPTLKGSRSFGDLSTKVLREKLRNRIRHLNKRGSTTQGANEDLQPEPDPQLNLLDLHKKEVI